jgi:hypothetical protein
VFEGCIEWVSGRKWDGSDEVGAVLRGEGLEDVSEPLLDYGCHCMREWERRGADGEDRERCVELSYCVDL